MLKAPRESNSGAPDSYAYEGVTEIPVGSCVGVTSLNHQYGSTPRKSALM